jgi:hypothetical protein
MGVLLYAVLLVTGLVLAYGGYPLYTFALFVLGAVFAAGGFYVFAAGARSGSPDLLAILSVGFVGGLVFLFVQILVILAGGFAVGWLAVTMLGVPNDALQALGGLVGAGLSLFLYAFVVIVGTAGIGAFLISKVVAAGPAADLSLILTIKESSLIFWVVFITGGLVQFGALISETEDERRTP